MVSLGLWWLSLKPYELKHLRRQSQLGYLTYSSKVRYLLCRQPFGAACLRSVV